MNANDPLWVAVEYENCFLGCGGQSYKDVDLIPEYYLAGEIEVCENTNTSYAAFDAIQDNPVTCHWEITDPAGNAFLSFASMTSVDIPWPLQPGKYTVVATPVNPGNFCNNEYTVYVNVNAGPPPLTAIEGALSICPGDYYTYEAVTNQGSVAYQWQIVNGSTVDTEIGDAINVQWGNNPPYELTVSQISTTGLACESLPFTQILQPIGSVNASGPTALCVEEQASYSATASGDPDYEWNISPANAGSILEGQGTSNIEVLWHIVGSATVTVSICGVDEIIPVDLAGFPEPEVLHPDELCPGSTGPVSTSTAFATYSWRNENGVQISSAANTSLPPGYYELVVTNANGCEGQASFEIDELPGPEVSISNPSLNVYCIPAGWPIPTLYALNTEEGYTYQWHQNGQPPRRFLGSVYPHLLWQLLCDGNGCERLYRHLQYHFPFGKLYQRWRPSQQWGLAALIFHLSVRMMAPV